MAAGTYTVLSLDVLEPVSKSYHITYSKRAFCVSQKLGEAFGSAKFFCGSFWRTVIWARKPIISRALRRRLLPPGPKRMYGIFWTAFRRRSHSAEAVLEAARCPGAASIPRPEVAGAALSI